MNIAGFQKTSTIDFPGKIACVLFTPSCNYTCWYCHNKALLHNPPLFGEAEVIAFLKKRAGLLDGVVLSGGEPTMQEDIVAFAATLKSLGYAVKLDTNGSNPDVVETLLHQNLVDYVALDYKVPFTDYRAICGYASEGVETCIGLLSTSTIMWELRTTVIPQLTLPVLTKMCQEIPIVPRFFLQPYRPVEGAEQSYYSDTQIQMFANSLQMYQPNIQARI